MAKASKKVIITCAVTGSIHTPSMSPYLPITPQVLDETPARTLPFRSGPRPGGMAFDGLLRRAGIRYEEIA